MTAPHLDDREALAYEVDHLVTCLRTGTLPDADGRAGLRTVRVLEAAQQSLERGSSVIRLDPEPTLRVPLIAPAVVGLPEPRPVIAIPCCLGSGAAAPVRSHG